MKLASDAQIKKRLIRLAYANPDLRSEILPLITAEKTAGPTLTTGGIIRDIADLHKALPPFLEEVLKKVANEVGYAFGQRFAEYKPSDERLTALFHSWLKAEGQTVLPLTLPIGNVLQRMVKKIKGTQRVWERQYAGWYVEVVAWSGNKIPDQKKIWRPADEIADTDEIGGRILDPIQYTGTTGSAGMIALVKNELSRLFVNWLNKSGTAIENVRMDVQSAIRNNKATIFTAMTTLIMEAIKSCHNLVYSGEPKPNIGVVEGIITASHKNAFQWPWKLEQSVDPKVGNDVKEALVDAFSKAAKQINSLVCGRRGYGLRIAVDGPTPDEIKRSLTPQLFKNVGGIETIVSVARAHAGGGYKGGFDCVKNKGTSSVKFASDQHRDEREFRANLIRLAHEKKHLRPHLLPLLQEHAE